MIRVIALNAFASAVAFSGWYFDGGGSWLLWLSGASGGIVFVLAAQAYFEGLA